MRTTIAGRPARPAGLAVRAGAAAALVVMVALLPGCASSAGRPAGHATASSPADGPLEGPEIGGGQGITNLASRLGAPYPYGGFHLCMPAGGTATLTAIEPVRTSGPLRIDRVGIAEFDRGAQGDLAPGTPLPAYYEAVEDHQVDRRCGAEGHTEVAVQVTRDAPGDAVVDGFIISYTVDGREYTDHWPIELTLCDPAGAPTADRCRQSG